MTATIPELQRMAETVVVMCLSAWHDSTLPVLTCIGWNQGRLYALLETRFNDRRDVIIELAEDEEGRIAGKLLCPYSVIGKVILFHKRVQTRWCFRTVYR